MDRTTIAISTNLRDRINFLVSRQCLKEHRKVTQEEMITIMVSKEEKEQ